ncbi:MAG TPA: hypothetical protein VGL31_15085, partial [Xanthobacteraceae bacterium]
MALDPRGAALALHRFGFGPKAGSTTGSIAAVASDPMGAILADLDAPNAGLITDANLRNSGAENRAVFEDNAERLAKDKLERKRKEMAQAMATGAESAMEPMAPDKKDDASPNPAPPKPVPLPRQIFLEEARARIG